MKLFKKLTALLLVLAMMFAFAACSNDDTDKDDKSEDKTEESSHEEKSEASEEDEKSEDEKSEDEKSEDEKSEDEKSKEDDNAAIVGEWEGSFDMSTIVSALFTDQFGFEVDVEFVIGITLELDDNGEYALYYDTDDAVEAAELMVEDVYDIYKDNAEDPVDYETFTANLDYEELTESLAGNDQSGKYELDGNKLYLDGDTENYLELDGDTLTWEVEDMFSIEFERA